MRLIIQPLDPVYKIMQVRVTELGNFLTCPFAYKYEEREIGNNEALLFGTTTHNVLETYMFNQEAAYDLIGIVCAQRQDWCDQICLFMQALMANEVEKKYRVICSEFKMLLEIECGDTLVIMEGTCDQIVKTQDNKYKIIDFKTSKDEWKQEKFEKEVQKIYYSAMLANIVGWENVVGFDYIVITKHKVPRLKIREYIADKDVCQTALTNAIKQFVISNKNNVRPAQINQKCFFCRCKKTCPMYQKSDVF